MLRKESIRCVYALAAQKGWGYDELHAEMEDKLGLLHLRTATPLELHNVLKELFGREEIVRDDPGDTQLFWLRKEAERAGISEKGITSICRKKFKERNIYGLSDEQRRGLAKAIKWIAQKNKKRKS